MWSSAVALVVLGLLVASPATAQVSNDLGAMADRIKAGGTLTVVTKDAGEVRGTLARLSAADVVVSGVDGRQRTIPAAAIGWIDTPGDSVWNGAVIGATFWTLPFAGAAGASCGSHCGRDVSAGVLEGVIFGGGMGALIDLARRGHHTVYGASPGSPNAVRSPEPVESTADLWSRVRPGDEVTIRTTAGTHFSGRFVRASARGVTVLVDGAERDTPATDITRVERHGTDVRRGALRGAAIFGALLGLTAGVQGDSGAGFAVLFGAYTGALWGAAIGWAIPRHIPVLTSQPASVHIRPLFTPDSRGIFVTAEF